MRALASECQTCQMQCVGKMTLLARRRVSRWIFLVGEVGETRRVRECVRSPVVTLVLTATVVGICSPVVCVHGVSKSLGRIDPSALPREVVGAHLMLFHARLCGRGFESTLLLLPVTVALLPS